MFGQISGLIDNTEFIPHLVWKDSFWYQLWHIDAVPLHLADFLFVCDPYGCACGPLSRPLTISMNHNLCSKLWQRLLYIRAACKQSTSTNMSALLLHVILVGGDLARAAVCI